ncbi:oxygen-regulated protein 1 [Cololabis saira]|uniref:oxygen-regulated protein 1 n=1 Tax=Cololabis saira TaxID=129043 RepID=UPI002AD25899|nr:oxygen-regulated protein 1 [Cololabis saira]
MSNTPVQDPPPAQEFSSGSGQTLPSRPLQSVSDPASKRVCFYKSGDYKFSGHRMIITARTFKTFDALLDALSKKVPLPFGVRTITTPRGTHLIKALDDIQDGGAYVCSDQKRVKPLNLDEVNRRQVPWNTTRPLSAKRLRRQGVKFGQFGRSNEATSRPAKVTDRVAVRTPKRLVVIKNRDPTVRRTVVLQKRTAPTFNALLDYLSQILQFPVLKLFSTDGRRVDGLPALILCSGVVVAAGNEPFRLGNSNFHRGGQMAQVMYVETAEASTLQPQSQKNKSSSSGRGSRNFSLSSERYIVNQINQSRNGSTNDCPNDHDGSFEAEAPQRRTPTETCASGNLENERNACIVPHEDDIEKSFRVNQDGSMTVEMKVRLTIKEEELLHWTTTVSRSSLSKSTVCASVSGSGNNSPDSNVANDSSNIQEDEAKEKNYRDGAEKGVGFNDDGNYEGYTTTTSSKTKTSMKRAPTPGPRHVNKKASVESMKVVTERGVQESTLGHYSYMERTADGETTEEYCLVRHSSSNRPVPKPRKTASAGASKKPSSFTSSGVAEVLQIQNDGMAVTETVMHIYESQGCYDNYFANEEYSVDGASLNGSPPGPESTGTDSGPRSSNNDCDIDGNWHPPTADSQRQNEEMLSLSSEPDPQTHRVTNKQYSVTENKALSARKTQISETVAKDNIHKSVKKKRINRSDGSQKQSDSTGSTGKKQEKRVISASKQSKYSSTDKLSSDASFTRKSKNSLESFKAGSKNKGAQMKAGKAQSMKSVRENTPQKDMKLSVSVGNLKRATSQRENINKVSSQDNGHNVNTSTGRPQMKKNLSDILKAKKSPLSSKTTISKPKSMIEGKLSPPKPAFELSECSSMPSLNPSPSEIHQYVENWLEKVSPDAVPYPVEAIADEAEPRAQVIFKIGADTESDEISECQNDLNDTMKKSSSCLSVPLCHQGPTALLHSEQRSRGLCVSMPSVRADHVDQENTLRSHKSAEAIGPDDSEMSTSDLLSPKAKIKPVLRQLCSSIQCIRRASASEAPSTLHSSNSLPDFSTQVASVFGSSCKALLSFLSVVTLRDNLNGPAPEDSNQSGASSEAMFMMESLQKISVMDDEEEQRASLTDLQSRSSSRFRERWQDFQILRERLESEPLSPKVSETEFALDVVSDGGDPFEDQNLGIDELMDELNMPQDLRAEITSTIQYSKSFYPVEESTYVETVRHHSDSEEDVEQFIRESEDEANHSPELDTAAEDPAEIKHDDDDDDADADDEHEAQEIDKEADEPSQEEEKEAVEFVEIKELSNATAIDAGEVDGEEEWEEDEKEAAKEMDEDGEQQEDLEEEEGSDKEMIKKIDEERDEQMISDGEEMGKRLEEETEEKDEALVEEETKNVFSAEDTDEREGAEETEHTENSEEGEPEEEEEEEDQKQNEVDKVEDSNDEIDDEEEEEAEEEVEESNETMGQVAEEKYDEEEVEVGEGDEIDAVTENHIEEEDIDEGNEEDEDEEDEGKEESKGEPLIEAICEGNSGEEEGHEDDEDKEQEEDKDSETDVDGEKCDEVEDGMSSVEKRGSSLEADLAEEEEVVDELEIEENMAAEPTIYEEEGDDDEEDGDDDADDDADDDEGNELDEGLKESEPHDKAEEGTSSEGIHSFSDDEDCKNSLEEASLLQQLSSSSEKASSECNPESPTKYSSEGHCEDDKGTDTVHETDEGGEEREKRSDSSSHPVEISQDLLDFVNFALQTCSLTFTYDNRGHIRIEPENARIVQSMIARSKNDSSYGVKRLPSPSTSDLSDYRPETSESGGYKTQDSVDIVSESGEEGSGKPFRVRTRSALRLRTKVEQASTKPSVASSTEALHPSRFINSGSFSSRDATKKASREDLSYFSAASSYKVDAEADTQKAQRICFTSDKESVDGVLIDRGRWLLKENHLIRNSPPVSLGMYGNLDSSSMDTGHDNTSEDSLHHLKTLHNPLAAISSSELEEMAKPATLKCSYYNMPHGSDSDPFLDDSSIRSAKRDASSVKGRGFRVSPTVNTSKTWVNKNGSLSSFASVEFKIPDRKVHPDGEPSAVQQVRRTSGGEQVVLQAQDSMDSLRLRCGQYCPIL